MPELPEVEVTRRIVEKTLVGRRIARVVTTRPSYFFLTPPARLKRELPGRRVIALERLGKYLLAPLDDGRRLLFHLGMTGQLFASGARSVRLLSAERRLTKAWAELSDFHPDRHTHLAIAFSDRGPELYFRDVRKFGKCALLDVGAADPRLEKLGPDALAVKGSALFAIASERRIPIKSLLLDQSVLAGVGNIYADEALFLAGLRPTRPASSLGRAECEKLVAAVRRVLLRAIVKGGSSIDDFVNPDGSDGGYQHEHRVYDREGEPCTRCRRAVVRVVIGARSAHYCPSCQR